MDKPTIYIAETAEGERRKRRKIEENSEVLTNNRRIEDKVFEGESITDFEIEEKRDWEKVLKDHMERLEEETEERRSLIKKKR